MDVFRRDFAELADRMSIGFEDKEDTMHSFRRFLKSTISALGFQNIKLAAVVLPILQYE